MYAGLTFTNLSGNILGSHQRINRMARQALSQYLTDNSAFPSNRLLLHFEGKNGPDGLKSKSSGQDEPWHYYDPFDPEDGQLLALISEHYGNLVVELKNHNRERSAFEAAWLAHAILDGMTPSHHYPFEEELEKLRGQPKETRTTNIKKVIMPGNSKRDKIYKNWQAWGFKGLFTTHFAFEWGAATIIATLNKRIALPNRYDLKTIKLVGLIEYYKRLTREIAVLDMYDDFFRNGWTSRLAKVVKKELAPRMAVMTTLAWYMAAHEAGIATGEV
jgi:hypothetical protein